MATRSPQPKPLSAAAVVAAVLSDRHIDGVHYRAGALVRMEGDKAKPYVDDGTFDVAAEAVAYRKSQGAEVIDHVPVMSTAESEAAADKAAAESN